MALEVFVIPVRSFALVGRGQEDRLDPCRIGVLVFGGAIGICR